MKKEYYSRSKSFFYHISPSSLTVRKSVYFRRTLPFEIQDRNNQTFCMTCMCLYLMHADSIFKKLNLKSPNCHKDDKLSIFQRKAIL